MNKLILAVLMFVMIAMPVLAAPKEVASRQNTTCYSEAVKTGSGAWAADHYVNITLDGEEATAVVEEATTGSASTSDASVVLFAAFAVISLAGYIIVQRVK